MFFIVSPAREGWWERGAPSPRGLGLSRSVSENPQENPETQPMRTGFHVATGLVQPCTSLGQSPALQCGIATDRRAPASSAEGVSRICPTRTVSWYRKAGPLPTWHGLGVLTCSVQKQGPGSSSVALLTPPRSLSGECAGSDHRDVGVLPWPHPQAGALLRLLSARPPTTFWVQARRCRHALQIPPEKLDLQVPGPGGGHAKPRLCAFSCGGRKGGGVGSPERQRPGSRRLLTPLI